MILTCPSCETKYEVDASALPAAGRTVRCAKCGNTWSQQPPEAEAPAQMPAAAVEAPVAPAEVPAPPAEVPAPPAEVPAAPVEAAAPQAPKEISFDESVPARPSTPPVIDDNFPDPLPGPDDDDDDDDDDFDIPSLEDFDDMPSKSSRGGRGGKKPGRGKFGASGDGKRIGLMIGWISLLVLFVGLIGGGLFARDAIISAWPPAYNLYDSIGLGDPPLSELLQLRGINPKPGRDKDGKAILTITGNIVNISGDVQHLPQLEGALLDAKRQPVHEWKFDAPKSELEPGEKITFSTMVTNPPKTAQGLKIGFVAVEKMHGAAPDADSEDAKKKDTH